MRKSYILFYFLFIGSSIVQSQNLEFYFGSGKGNSNMADLKSVQRLRISSIDVPAKLTENFPATFHYLGETRFKVSSIYLGWFYSYSSTGSRISYNDYSGSLNFDIISSSHKLGPLISLPLYTRGNFLMNLSLSTPVTFSKVTFKDYLEIYGDYSKDSLTVYSSSLSFFPNAEIIYKISHMRLGIRYGYLIDTKGFLHKRNDKEMYLTSSGTKVYTNWSGYQLEFLLGVSILSKPFKPIHLREWINWGNPYYYRK